MKLAAGGQRAVVDAGNGVLGCSEWFEENRDTALQVLAGALGEGPASLCALADVRREFCAHGRTAASDTWAVLLQQITQAHLARVLVAERYEPLRASLYAFALSRLHDRHAAEDVVHHAFARYLEGRCAALDPKEVQAWLFRVVSNRIKDLWRERSRVHPLDGETHDITRAASPADDPEEIVIRADLVQRFHASLQLLPPRQREIMLARIEGGGDLGPRDLGPLLGIGAETVKTHLDRAWTRCRQMRALQITDRVEAA
jgi:RNA polymerase sigma factor (sigma-70 family)